MQEVEQCPNCNLELELSHIGDQYAGDVLMTASCNYCPECLYITNEKIKLSK